MKRAPKRKDFYLLHIVGDTEPFIHGHFKTADLRDQGAKKLKARVGDNDGIFMLDIVAKRGHAIPTIPKAYAYSAAFFTQPCEICKGKGTVPCDYCNGEGLDMGIPCYECNSKGTVPCPQCDGTGVMDL